MGTVSKEIADRIIAGEFPEDEATKITKYTNAWGGESYGVTFHGMRNVYAEPSEFIINPTLYWSKENGKVN